MNKVSRLWAALAALALANGAFAQQGVQLNGQANTGLNVGGAGAAVSNPMGGANAVESGANGVSLDGTVGTVGVNPEVQVQAGVAGSQETAVSGERTATVENQAAGVSQTLETVLHNVSAVAAPIKEGGAQVSAADKSGVAGSYHGKVKFDGANKGVAGSVSAGMTPTLSAEAMMPEARLGHYAPAAEGKQYGPDAKTQVRTAVDTLPTLATVALGGDATTAGGVFILTSWARHSDAFMKVWGEIKQILTTPAEDTTGTGRVFGLAGKTFKLGALTVAAPFVYAGEIAVDLVWPAMQWAWDGIKEFAKAAWQFVKDVANAAWEAIKDLAQFVADMYKAAVEAFKQFMKDAWQFIKDVANAVWTFVKDMAQAFADFMADAWQFIKDVATAVWNAVKDFAKAAWEFIKDAAQFIYDNVLTPLGHLMSGASAAVVGGIVAGLVVIAPFAAGMFMRFVVTPIAQTLNRAGSMPLAFSIPATLAVLAGVVYASISLPVLQALGVLAAMTVAGSFVTGAFGGGVTGFTSGIKSGNPFQATYDAVAAAWKVATGNYGAAMARYNEVKASFKK